LQPLTLNVIDKVFHILDQFTNEKSQWGIGVAVVGDGCDLRFLYVGCLYRRAEV
jgi:hypothetical protein